MKLKAMKAVYTYFFPEVRKVMHSTDSIESKFYLTTTSIEEAQNIVDSLNFKRRIIVPKTLDGRADLDTIHEPVIERIIEVYNDLVLGIKDFKNRYFTSGTSEGIFHTLAELKAKGVNKIFTLTGEYEGYKEYSRTLGIETMEVNLDKTKLSSLERGIWFISNPSAREGNIIRNEEINEICDLGNKVFLDLAYVGSTKDYKFDISHENVQGAFLSFSKPYGVFRFRIGFTFSRDPLNSLYANKWFKDIPRVLTAVKIAEEIGPRTMHEKYKDKQKKIIKMINEKFSLNIEASDALLLGNISSRAASASKLDLISTYKRGENYRLCLTPYYEIMEANDEI